MKLIWRLFFISIGTVTCATFILFMVVDSVTKKSADSSVRDVDNPLQTLTNINNSYHREAVKPKFLISIDKNRLNFKNPFQESDDSSVRDAENPPQTETSINNSYYREAVIQKLLDKYKLNFEYPLRESPWFIAAKWVKPREIHPEYSPELGSILKSLSSGKIVLADVGVGGTQPKLVLTLEGGQKAVFKPKWYERDYIVEGPEPYAGRDRHNGEIVAFHLGRILEFRRTPLAVGRKINLMTDILPVAKDSIKNTFTKKYNNTCFYGVCHYCKTPVCAEGDILEGSMILWLPDSLTLKMHLHPWRRTYRKNKPAKWETSDTYCSTVKTAYLQNLGSEDRLLDIIDTAILDFLIGNADRHNYEIFTNFTNTALLILDNAKSLGNPYIDERSILAPLYQCCRLRYSTWQRLLFLQEGILSQVLNDVLFQDPIAPVITEEHLVAIERRHKTVLSETENCIKKHSIENVLSVGIVPDR